MVVGHAATLEATTRQLIGQQPRPAQEFVKIVQKVRRREGEGRGGEKKGGRGEGGEGRGDERREGRGGERTGKEGKGEGGEVRGEARKEGRGEEGRRGRSTLAHPF